MIERLVAQVMLGNDGVQQLVGAQVYPSIAEQDASDEWINYRRTGGTHLQTSSGPLEDEQATMEVDCVSENGYAEAKALDAAVKLALESAVTVDCRGGDPADLTLAGSTGDESRIMYVVRRSYNCWTV